jgi:hypothetical protein
MATDKRTCRSCGADIEFVVVANNQGRKPARMPLNPHPDPTGNVAVLTTSSGGKNGRVLNKNQQPAPYETLYQSHFATCPKASEHRKQRGQWTSAQAAHAREGRRRRTQPTTPPMLPGMGRISPGRTP